jgi:hypothetical protein
MSSPGGGGPAKLDFQPSKFYSFLMKKFLTLVLVLVLAGMASAQVTWFKGPLDQAAAKAKADHKLVLVDFYSYT